MVRSAVTARWRATFALQRCAPSTTRHNADVRTRLTRTALAWIVFFGGFAMEMAVDYGLRARDCDMGSGGIPEVASGWRYDLFPKGLLLRASRLISCALPRPSVSIAAPICEW